LPNTLKKRRVLGRLFENRSKLSTLAPKVKDEFEGHAKPVDTKLIVFAKYVILREIGGS
jgi:hypothetical protein